ncbi:MAG: protein O-mannosyl-transferase family [Planctomycetota bacterium]
MRRRKKKKAKTSFDKINKLEDVHKPAAWEFLKRKEFIAGFLFAAFLFIIYLTTMLQGVDSGDSAELQFVSPLLGVCHPPGYSIEVCFGKLFSILPVGPDIAWRINFMMTVCGVIGSLALYGTIRRITGSILAAITAAATLGFSSIYWTYSLVAEVYVFYSMFLLLGIYCIVRFAESDKAFWFYLAALSFGVCVADRISEILVLPGFLFLWLTVRKKVRLDVVRVVIAMVIFLLPFAFTVSYHLIRGHPEKRLDRLYSRDSALRYQILGDNFKIAKAPPLKKRISRAVKFCLGLTYKKDASFHPEVMKWDVNKYAWLLSGMGAGGQRFQPGDRRNSAQGKGTSIGILGILLVLLAVFFQRENRAWLIVGFWFFAANLGFILWHHRWDNLTFTIPGLIGLSLLVGLGAAGGHWKSKQLLLYRVGCLVVPLFLLLSNFALVNRNTPQEKKLQDHDRKLAKASFPSNGVIISTYWPAMNYRYLIHIQAGREDVQILHENVKNWQKLIAYFLKNGQPVYLQQGSMRPELLKQCERFTEPDVWQVGFAKLLPLPSENRSNDEQ